MPSHYCLCCLPVFYFLFLIRITKLLQSFIITFLCRWCRKSSGWIQETALPLGQTLWYPWRLLMIILRFQLWVLGSCQGHLFGSLEFSPIHILSKVVMLQYWADLATEWKRQVTTAHANQTTGLTNGRAANWAPEVEFSPLHALSCHQMKFLFCC